MAANFDPYHAWLGIPKGSRPLNYYQLLGLKLFVSEPPLIAEAADTQIDKVAPHLRGENAALARRVSDEIANAKKLLLNAEARRKYDAQLRQQMGLPAAGPTAPQARAPAAAPPTPPRATPAAAPQAMPVSVPAAQPMAAPVATAAPVAMAAPMAAPVFGQAPQSTPFGAPFGSAPFGSAPVDPNTGTPMLRRPVAKRKKSSAPMGIIVVVAAILVLSGALTYAFRNELSDMIDNVTGTPRQTADNQPPAKVSVGSDSNRQASRPRQYNDVYDKSRDGEMGPPEHVTGALEGLGAPGSMSDSSSDSMPQRRGPGMGADRKTPPPADSGGFPPASPTATPMVKTVTVNVPSTQATPEETTAIEKSLAAARTALSERNIPKAQEQTDLALLEATSGQSIRSIEKTRVVIDLIRQFWDAVREGVKGLTVAEELTVGDTTMIVVDNSDGKLIVRANGQNREYTIEKIPTALAKMLAERWLKEGDTNTKILIAAFMTVDPKGDPVYARDLVDQVAGGNVDLAEILSELAMYQQ